MEEAGIIMERAQPLLPSPPAPPAAPAGQPGRRDSQGGGTASRAAGGRAGAERRAGGGAGRHAITVQQPVRIDWHVTTMRSMSSAVRRIIISEGRRNNATY